MMKVSNASQAQDADVPKSRLKKKPSYLAHTVTIHGGSAHCSGESSGDGHPEIYLDLTEHGRAICPYCSQLFEKLGSTGDTHGGFS